MKKIMIIAAAVAALAACSKEAETVVDANHFEKGQKVTLTVKAGEPSTRVSSELNADGETVDFKWQANDKIKVTVNGQPEEFTLSSGAGEAEATFTGTMPAGGSTFSVQYPSGDTPDLSTQTYSGTEALPHDKMLFTAENCQLSDLNFKLTAQYSALQLNLYGSKAVGSIVVTTKQDPAKTYTLDCSGTGSGTEPGKTNEPKPFYIVVPAGTYGFTVTVNDVSNVLISSKSTTSDQTFEANEFLKMPPLGYPGTDVAAVTIGGVTWAPVNCGYDASHTYGLLYQWGRKYGQAYETGTITPTAMNKSDDTESNKAKFGLYNDTDYNWYNDVAMDNTLWNGSSKGTSDPCPTGWRVPTLDELGSLCYTDWDSGSQSGTTKRGSWNSTYKGWYFGVVFLPAAGYRDYYNGNAGYRGDYGYYWSSSVYGTNAWGLCFDSGSAYMYDYIRTYGFSVRCVQE